MEIAPLWKLPLCAQYAVIERILRQVL